jgi:hypothetical protein
MQLESLPTAEELASGYREVSSDAYLGEEQGQRTTARRLLERESDR